MAGVNYRAQFDERLKGHAEGPPKSSPHRSFNREIQ
jgi:hypothetical protein